MNTTVIHRKEEFRRLNIVFNTALKTTGSWRKGIYFPYAIVNPIPNPAPNLRQAKCLNLLSKTHFDISAPSAPVFVKS